MRKIYTLVALLLTLVLTTAVAQENKKTTKPGGAASKQKAGAQQNQVPAMPGKAEMQKMKFMVGNWTTSEKFEPDDFSKGGTGTGTARLHWGPGGLSLLQNYDSKNNAFGNLRGHAILFWDAKAGGYKSFWCDSMMGCDPQFATGKWEGDKLIFTGQTEYQGKRIMMRTTFSDIKPDSFTWTQETSVDDGPMKPSTTIQYTKAAGPKPMEKPQAAQ